jgi:two-component system CheB/CheR fusion protein
MPDTSLTADGAGLEPLLEYLKRNRGFDFTGYKRASLARRIQKRMHAVGVRHYADYVDYLEVHPDEFAELFNTILINVTAFFRDSASWEYLASDVLPDLLASRGDVPIRAWSAGCASGEEAYTIAMVLAELLGLEAYRDRVKVYATDIDDEALEKARQATYTAHEVEGVPAGLLEKYFERNDSAFTFRKDMRRQVIFGRHDLIQDAPISRVDLLVSRNTLMYFNAETQSRILKRFHFALNDGGVLFLGRAEALLTHADTFHPIDLKRRISTKVPRAGLPLHDRLILMERTVPEETGNGPGRQIRLREAAHDHAPVAQLAIDAQGVLLVANERARSLFALQPLDIGRPLQDLKISYRPVELRSLLDRARADRHPAIVPDVEWRTPAGDTRWLELQVVPLFEDRVELGASITFTDVSASKRLQRDLEHAHHELESAYEELQSTNEELETTNEELQSTIEELETTNEELQSTNEELETMNEELQSTNEELETMNDEIRQRSLELDSVNGFLESILRSLRGGVVVVDTDVRVLVWNDRSTDLWGLREDEAVGRHLFGLDIGLPLDQLRQPVRASLAGPQDGADGVPTELELDATNRRGRPIRCRVTLSRLTDLANRARGVILLMEEVAEGQPWLGPADRRGAAAGRSTALPDGDGSAADDGVAHERPVIE